MPEKMAAPVLPDDRAASGRPTATFYRLRHVLLLATARTTSAPFTVRFRDGALTDTPFTMLVHTRDDRSPRTRILTSATGALAVPAGGMQAALVPTRLLPMQPDPVAARELPDTPLVRASRATLALLLSSGPPDEDDSAAGTEDVVITLVRAILSERRRCDPSPDHDPVGERVRALILARHRDPGFDVGAIARELCFSRRQLYRRASTDVGVAAQITRQRLSTAMELIGANPSRALADIAAESGFPGLANMRAAFTARVGVTPSVYRRRAVAARR